ncbi:MAG TPA: hypothetical protein VFB60_11080 [Ktedonobacteraceae bacterium]|nr:hypothetical protein [Ktedonobacteraceae bacterium]
MAQGPRYVLPVAVLLATMSDLQATVTAQTHLAALPEADNEACLAELTLVQGHLRHCRISTLPGQVLLQQAAALHLLERLGELEWRLQPSSPDAFVPREATQRRWQVAVPLSAVRGSLSQREKQVLLLIESQHGPEQIARLLCLSGDQIEQLVEALAARALIRPTEERRNR